MEDRTQWFAECGWGVLCHYLGAPPSSDGGAELTSEDWNEQVGAVDVDALAEQLCSVHVPYFFITLGQNSGHYMAPNPTYDEYVGVSPSKCSRRDLVADLYDALRPRGIPLLVYVTSGAPSFESQAVQRLGWAWGFEGQTPGIWCERRTGMRLVEFQRKWETIIRDWSTRWGRRVCGWWVDGCYFADQMYRFEEEPNFESFANALRSGNPEAIVAFNPGVTVPLVCHSKHEDYTAGEISQALPECPGPWVERDGHKARYHVLSYLGSFWCKGEQPRFPDQLVVGYTKHVVSKGGVVTWDVPIQKDGLIPDAFIEQLRVIGESMKT